MKKNTAHLHVSYSPAIVALLVAGMCTVLVVACKGNDLPDKDSDTFFGGKWALNYDVLVDECELVPEGENQFQDTQEVSQSGNLIVVKSRELSPENYIGELREDSSFEAQVSNEGDLFGDGVRCTLTEALAYNNQIENEVSSLYDLRLRCDDGFYCVSALRGVGTRMVETTP